MSRESPLLPWSLSRETRDALATPALVLDRPTLRANVRRMIAQAGGVERLRPHVKTHKCPGVVRVMLDEGVAAFKCATVAEADMLTEAGARDVMLAYPLTGPWPRRYASLAAMHRGSRFSAIVDAQPGVDAIAAAATAAGVTIEAYLDVDPGLHRTGVAAGPEAEAVYRRIASATSLVAAGFHVYDGHLRQHDPAEREAAIARAFAPIEAMRERLSRGGVDVPRVVAGGTGSFPIHGRRADRQCSPGTCTLSDLRSRGEFADIDYPCAAAVATRVVSKPTVGRLTLDLGHKAVASEHPLDRRVGLVRPGAAAALNVEVLGHGEEHLVVRTDHADALAIGDLLLGVPYHVCPTSAMHEAFDVVEGGEVVDRWPITARNRRLRV